MAFESILNLPLSKHLLGERSFRNEEERTRTLFLVGLIVICVPIPLVYFFLIANATGQSIPSLLLAELVLIALVPGLRRSFGVKPTAFAFGLAMEFVFIESVVRLESPAGIIGLVIVPCFTVLTAGRLLASALLAQTVALILGLHRFLPPFRDIWPEVVNPFSAPMFSETVNSGALSVFVFIAACMIEQIIHNLFAVHEAEQKRMRHEIAARKEKERLLETVFRSVPLPLFVRDREQRYSMCNDAFLGLIGKRREEAIGKRFDELLSISILGTSKETDRNMMETGLSQRYSARVELPDGHQTITVFKVPLENEAGEYDGSVGAILDETDRYDRERKLEELLDSNRSALALLGHDLKNPIGSFMNLVRDMDRDECVDPVEFHEVLGEMGESLGALYRLLEELLDWAKADASIADFSPAPIRLAPCVENILTLYRLQAEEKGLTVSTGDLDTLAVYADERMLDTILRNLVGNAVKFTPRGGEIRIGGRRAVTGDGTEITVSDTGIGMSVSMLGALFEYGGVKQRRGTEGEAGTGLGLGLCRRLIDRHGANLIVDSVEGRGSTFTVVFPDRKEPQKEA